MNPEPLIEHSRPLVLTAFFSSLAAFTAIGVLSGRKKTQDTEDYLLAGRNVPAWLVALSAVATINSGFMFIGAIGYTYSVGLSSAWMLIGWGLGDYVAWKYLYGKVRAASERENERSTLALMTPREARGSRLVLVCMGLLTVFYLAMYAAAQLNAGSTALSTIFGLPDWLGAVIGALIVLIYCVSGGIRASIWTDAAQSMVMMSAMILLVLSAVSVAGHPGYILTELNALQPGYGEWFPETLAYGFWPFFLGWVFGGLGVIGQPHIVIRSMCLNEASKIQQARRIYFAFLIPFYTLAILVGLYARKLLPHLAEVAGPAAERALPELALLLLPAILVGVTLAGLFSATMSTADSQVIACTATLTQDLFPKLSESYALNKLCTLLITATALMIALFSSDGVFALVLDAWAVLSATLGPLLILGMLHHPCGPRTTLALLLSGFLFSNWYVTTAFNSEVYVNFPGMVLPLILYGLLRMLGLHHQ